MTSSVELRINQFIEEVKQGEKTSHLDLKELHEELLRWSSKNESASHDQISKKIIQSSLSNMDIDQTDWTYVAASVYLKDMYKIAQKNRGYSDSSYGSFYELIQILTQKQKGQRDYTTYDKTILTAYTKDEINEIGSIINPDLDKEFSYIALRALDTRYLARPAENEVYELPQERWLIIAMTLMRNEKDKETRMKHIKEAYWALSNRYMTVATPTLANAGLSYGQLSSCFIDVMGDSLNGIYNTDKDVATLSKEGGGLAVYAGKVRSKGSTIKDFAGASSGIVPWIKKLNSTAVAVDQLGRRKGAVAVYLDVWHKDIYSFLDLKLNNGDERQRAHDIFTGVCLPDLFMEAVEARDNWYLFDPHEVKKVMGFSLEDSYDEERGKGSFRDNYYACVQNKTLSRTEVPAIEIMKRIMKSQLETGTPYMFYRDEVNRMNPNKHAGMVYSSNLCSEIMQNMSESVQVDNYMDEDGYVVTKIKPGDFVVCNLSSVNLGAAVPANVLERLIPIQVRMLDNVIDLNTIEVKQADATSNKYRAIGLGTFGWHHLLALQGIQWESEEAVEYCDALYERIAYLTIKASSELAEEKGAYPVFEGSDWHTGAYFTDRNYKSVEWKELAENVASKGIRNAYLMAVAPNSSTSVIADSTASIDPVFKEFYHEEKKDFKLPIAAPDLDHRTYDVYRRSAYIVDQRWSIKQNAKRQKHVDQAISFNFYVPNTIKASILLGLHMQAWKEGLKTTYYVRSTASDIEQCEWCES